MLNFLQKLEYTMQKRINRIGVANPRCWICGESRVMALEIHHVGGQHKGKTEILCRNCHSMITAYQHASQEELEEIENEKQREQIGYALMLYQHFEYEKRKQGLNIFLLFLNLAYLCFISLNIQKNE